MLSKKKSTLAPIAEVDEAACADAIDVVNLKLKVGISALRSFVQAGRVQYDEIRAMEVLGRFSPSGPGQRSPAAGPPHPPRG